MSLASLRNFRFVPHHVFMKRSCSKVAEDVKPSRESKDCVESQPLQLPEKQVQVCIFGADAPTGHVLSFLLKQNPFVSILHLQGTVKVDQMGIDLSHFDTRCKIRTHVSTNSAAMACKSADIVMIMGLETQPTGTSLAKVVMAEAPRVVSLAETCTKYSPKAILVVAAAPVSVMLPVVELVYKKTDWYHPGRLLGAVPLAQVKANSLAGYYQNLDPQSVHVPIIGGPDLDVAVPLFTQTSPAGMSVKDSEKLMEVFREGGGANCPQSQAFSLNRLVTNIAMGLTKMPNALVTASVRSNIINTCRHIVCTVQMKKGGIFHNYGVPKLFKTELKHFERALLTLKSREEMADEFVCRPDQRALPAFMARELEEERINKEGIVR